MGPRPFSRGNDSRIMVHTHSFALQWGHDLSAVETTLTDITSSRVLPASMGPRPFSRGNRLLLRGWQMRSSFNGATTFQPWKRVDRDTLALLKRLQWGHDLSAVETGERNRADIQHCRASMGPRPFSRGNRGTPRPQVRFDLSLQWGHDLSAVETRETPTTPPTLTSFNGATTFQPWKRGDVLHSQC